MERYAKDVESLHLEIHADSGLVIVVEESVAEAAQNDHSSYCSNFQAEKPSN